MLRVRGLNSWNECRVDLEKGSQQLTEAKKRSYLSFLPGASPNPEAFTDKESHCEPRPICASLRGNQEICHRFPLLPSGVMLQSHMPASCATPRRHQEITCFLSPYFQGANVKRISSLLKNLTKLRFPKRKAATSTSSLVSLVFGRYRRMTEHPMCPKHLIVSRVQETWL